MAKKKNSSSAFGQLLREYRMKTRDSYTGKCLTQHELGQKLADRIGIYVHRNKVSKWESGRSPIYLDEREILIGILAIFLEYKGISSIDEADLLLETGGYKALNSEETTKIDPRQKLGKDRLAEESLQEPYGSKTGITTIFQTPPGSPQGLSGRDNYLNSIANPLVNNRPVAPNVSSITLRRMGGAGKTTPKPKTFVVGRTKEIEKFSRLLKGNVPYALLNIYGPGGIGKTIVGQKMQEYAVKNNIPHSFIAGDRPDLTPDRILYTIKEDLVKTQLLHSAFDDFEREYTDYLIVQEVLQRGGGIQVLFDTIGNVKDPMSFAQIVQTLGKSITDAVQRNLSNRFALERYLRGVERTLAAKLAENLHEGLESHNLTAAVIIDTYEEMEGLDDWVCQVLVPALPNKLKIVVLGRNALPKVNFDWSEFNEKLFDMELEELPETDAKAYLAHFGLRDESALDKVYRFTGGYPLLLVLVRYLAREAGGWDKIGVLENLASRDQIATQLLQRILREERVTEVQAFLEKGVIARWFNPEIIGLLLEMNPEDARKIYDKLSRHSFVEKHEYGLKFHDKIRELLLERLKFTSKTEYEKLVRKLTDYYREKAGLDLDNQNQQNLDFQN